MLKELTWNKETGVADDPSKQTLVDDLRDTLASQSVDSLRGFCSRHEIPWSDSRIVTEERIGPSVDSNLHDGQIMCVCLVATNDCVNLAAGVTHPFQNPNHRRSG